MTKKKGKGLAMFDTVSACNKGARIELLDPEGDGSGIFISILGTDSDEFKNIEKEQRDYMNRKIMLARKRGQDLRLDSAEMSDEKEIDMLSRITTGWENMPDEFEVFSKEAAQALYKKYPSIRRQMNDASGDMQNFTMS